ncbi:MAG TPA: universal stress protein [Devosiaceae bacterium]|nr:universal stress protein [Devosiaceae bacterium]
MRTVEDYKRKFLVLIDEGEECAGAAAFAAYRVRRTGGTVVFLAVIDSADFQQFLGVEEVMRAEAVEEAEQLLETHTARAKKIGDIKIETVIREGRPAEAIEALVAEDKDIAILVLGASRSSEGPGELVTAFAAHGGANALRIPVTIIPGTMTDAEIEAVS